LDTIHNIVTLSSKAGFSYWASFAKDSILALAAITASVVALIGINTWRKELRGKVEYDIARRLLRSIYKICEDISIVRQPMVTTQEAVSALMAEGKEPKDSFEALGKEGMLAVYDRRWKYVSDDLSELREEYMEAKAIWGERATIAVKPFLKSVSMLRFYVGEHLGNIQREEDNYADEKEFKKQIRDAIMSIDEEDKEPVTKYGKELKLSLSCVESFLKPYLSK
jgi:hypothetical protein